MANAAMIVDMCTRLLLETWVTKAQFRWGGACEPSQSKTTAVSVDSYFWTNRDRIEKSVVEVNVTVRKLEH